VGSVVAVAVCVPLPLLAALERSKAMISSALVRFATLALTSAIDRAPIARPGAVLVHRGLQC
jgi:hypothetical protein